MKLALTNFCNEANMICCPISEAWFYLLHKEGSSLEELDAWLEVLQTTLLSCMDSVCTPDLAHMDNSPPPMVDDIIKIASSAVVGEYTGFPGPMCSPFRRSLATMLSRGHEYTFTEKSDGIRVLVVSIRVARFPRWVLEQSDRVGGPNELDHLLSTSLVDLMSLEDCRRRLHGGGGDKVTVQLRNKSFEMQKNTNNAFILQSNSGCVCHVVRRIESRHFSYMFDRSMNCTYLLLDEYPLGCEYCVLDGELMKVADDTKKTILGLFDLFAYKNSGESEVKLTHTAMCTRHDKLRSLIQYMHEIMSSQSLKWFVKEMWAVDRMKECLDRLECRGVREYVFHGPYGPTKNDGIIFTPNTFPIIGGASRTQFKWKWPALLSIDWLVSPVEVQVGDSQLCDVWLFFRKKNFNYRLDIEGHWKFEMQLNLCNPHNYYLPVGDSVVVECVYITERKLWSMDRIRDDRREANSIVTAISVLESLVENVDSRELCTLLGISDEYTLQRIADLQPSVETLTTKPNTSALNAHCNQAQKSRLMTALILRAVQKGNGSKLCLCWCTNKGNPDCRKSIPCTLCEVCECSGLGLPRECDAMNSGTISLTNFLYIQLGNAGGSYAWSDFTVDAYFDGTKGHWVLVKCYPHGKNYMCAFDRVLLHLSWLLEQGRGDAARDAIPIAWYGSTPPLPPIKNEDTKRRNAHYATKVEELSRVSNEERCASLMFNNWVKSAVIDLAVQNIRSSETLTQSQQGLAIVDACCGRGGDLLKWKDIQPDFVFLTDASPERVAEAAARYSYGKGLSVKSNVVGSPGFPAYFDVHDAFDSNSGLQRVLRREIRRQKKQGYHLLSCQFSLHYACSSLERVQAFVSVVSASLVSGGLFIGSTVSDDVLLERFYQKGSSFGNAHYSVNFPEESSAILREHKRGDALTQYGIVYFATLANAVSNLVEYVVPWKMFCELCGGHGLELVLESNFITFFEDHHQTSAGQNLMGAAKRSRNGIKEMSLSTQEIEAASIYRVFIFEKRDSKVSVQ